MSTSVPVGGTCETDALSKTSALSFGDRQKLNKEKLWVAKCGFYGQQVNKGYCSLCCRKQRASGVLPTAPAQEDTYSSHPCVRFKSAHRPGLCNDSAAMPQSSDVIDSSSNRYSNTPNATDANDNQTGQAMAVTEQRSVVCGEVRSADSDTQPWGSFAESLMQIIDGATYTEGTARLFPATDLASMDSWVDKLESGYDYLSSYATSYVRATSPEQLTTKPKEYFKEQMRHPEAQDVVLRLKSYVRWFNNTAHFTPTEQADSLTDFLVEMEKRLRGHHLWVDLSPQNTHRLVQGMRRHVHNRVFATVFCAPEDRASDQAFRNKCTQLKWVRVSHIMHGEPTDKTNRLDENYDNAHLYTKARNELLKINATKPPEDKLNCILHTARAIFRIGAPDAIGADDFLPLLIYVVITAHVPRLLSNLAYLTRYCDHTTLRSGERGYFFTTLCCAVSVIERFGPSNAGLTEDQYNSYIAKEPH